MNYQIQKVSLNEDAQLENSEYLSRQLITYIGNKRALLDFISRGLSIVQQKLDKDKLSIFDVFSGSGIVSRFFKKYSDLLIVNDLENYAEVINRCYLANETDLDVPVLSEIYNEILFDLNEKPLQTGIISEMYAPEKDEEIKKGERAFYTTRNAKYIDTARMLISELDSKSQPFFIAPLLSEASIHANTAGVFKGFYKCKNTGIGQFGGTNGDALFRIKGHISLPFPVFSNFSCDVAIFKGDSNTIVDEVPEVDVAYLDPPYNQHPYGSNYFMLNLVTDYKKPESFSRISGIPENWNRSFYNKRTQVYETFRELLEKLRAKYVLISFNSEGFISPDSMIELLNTIGTVRILETKYNTFRGSRNLRNREIHVKEYLYLVEKY